jgi:hypothetical protein
MCALGPSHRCESAQQVWLSTSESSDATSALSTGITTPMSNTGRG